MDPIPLPAPYAGVNEQLPKIAVQAPFCENLLNFNVTQEGTTLRKGDSKYISISPGYTPNPSGLVPYGVTELFIVDYRASTTEMKIYNSAGALVYTSAASGVDTLYPLQFNNYLYLFGSTVYRPGFVYNGTIWATIGWTAVSGNFYPIGGNVYNSRAYLIQKSEAAYWYTDIGQVTGVLDNLSGTNAKIDLTTVISEKAFLTTIAKVTIADNVSAVTFQSFIFSSGEVLFYSGSYPDSADWSLVGRAFVGSPLNYNSGIEYQGDYLLFCDNGVVSLRDLFLKGSEAAVSLSVNSSIQESWIALVQAMRTAFTNPVGPINPAIQGVWDPISQRIIISFPAYLDSSGAYTVGSYYFIFNTEMKSWSFHQSFGNINASGRILGITKYKSKVLLLSEGSSNIMVYEKEGSSGFTDRSASDDGDVGYEYELLSAPVANGRAYVQKAAGLDVILKSDLYDQTNYQLVRDFGVETSTAQKIPGTGISGNLAKPFVNIGIEGSYIQYKISGTTTTGKAVGLQVYGTNFWTDNSDAPR